MYYVHGEDSCSDPPDVTYATVTETRQMYNHGEMAKYECQKGFTFSEQDSALCVEGMWMSIPNCVSTSCKRPPAVQNARLKQQVKTSYASGEKVTYLCNAGYSLERSFTGDALCENTQWKNLPVCRSSCSRPERLIDAELQGDWDADSYPENTQAIYQCRPGYSRLGTIKRICLFGKWEVVSKGECRKKSCGHPGDIPFGSFQLLSEDAFVFGAVVEYSCDDGYQMVSKEKSRQCTATGWSNFPPHCEEIICTYGGNRYRNGDVIKYTCPPGKRPTSHEGQCFYYGWGPPPDCQDIVCTIPDTSDLIRSPHYASYRLQTKVFFQCQDGFSRVGSSNSVCTEKDWNPPLPSCQEITCTISKENNLVKELSEMVFKVNDKATLRCKKGFPKKKGSDKTTCTEKGWDPPLLTCEEGCTTPEIQNGFLKTEQQASYDLGSSVEFECVTDYVLNSPKSVKCENGEWTDLPVCLGPCKISSEDFTKHNIQLLSSDDPKNNLDRNYKHGTELRVVCKPGYRRPGQAALVIECFDGKLKYPRCYSGSIIHCFNNKD